MIQLLKEEVLLQEVEENTRLLKRKWTDLIFLCNQLLTAHGDPRGYLMAGNHFISPIHVIIQAWRGSYVLRLDL